MDMVVSSSGVFAFPITAYAPIVMSMLPCRSDTLFAQKRPMKVKNVKAADVNIP